MPKTYRQLWEPLVRFENLWRAYGRARRGKRSRPAIARYELDAESRLFDLQSRLEAGTYQPGAYRTFVVREWKQRIISAAPFEDRIVHHALCQVLEPIWEARFIHDTYACRVGKGTLAALDRAQHFARRFAYVLQLDIRAFFPAMDHAILLTTLRQHVGDQRVLHLCEQIIAGGRDIFGEATPFTLFAGDDLLALGRPRGLPIGNLTSQFWANVYLHPFDLWVKHTLGARGYVRYCDDLLLFADDKATLHGWCHAIEAQLATIRLTIHPKRAQVGPVAVGFPFVGWVIQPARRRLRRRNVVHFWRRYRQRVAAYQAGELSFDRLNATVQGWLGSVRHGSTLGLRRAVLRMPLPRVGHG